MLTIYDDQLKEHGFQFKQYYAIPLKDKFAFMATYNVPGIKSSQKFDKL